MPNNTQKSPPPPSEFDAQVREMLEGLKRERDLIAEAIRHLEALAGRRLSSDSSPRRRGRPPGSKNKPRATAPDARVEEPRPES